MKKILIISWLGLIHFSLYSSSFDRKFIAITGNISGNYYNPAQMMDIQGFKVTTEYQNYQNVDNLYYFDIGLYKNWSRYTLGFGYEKMGALLELDQETAFNYGNSIYNFYGSLLIRNNISAGLLCAIPSIETREFSFSSMDISPGMLYCFEKLNIAVLLRNIIVTDRYNENQTEIITGGSYNWSIDFVEIKLFTDAGIQRELFWGLGLESSFRIQKTLALIALKYYENFGLGFGLKYHFFQVNYEMIFAGDLGIKNIIGLTFFF